MLLAAIAFVWSAQAFAHDHNYVNGICQEEDCYAPYQKPEIVDGWYQLANAGNVEWFAEFTCLNDKDQQLSKAVLTADIDFAGVTHSPIGQTSGIKYNGEFDGQFHHIKNLVMVSDAEATGFFGWVRGGTKIRNLFIDESCSFTGEQSTGALIGRIQTNVEGQSIEILNVVNQANVTSRSGVAAAIIGEGVSGYAHFKMHNCVNTGNITGATFAAAFCGYNNNSGAGNSQIWTCYNTGNIYPIEGNNNVFRGSYRSVANTYDFATSSESNNQGKLPAFTTDDPIASGELCYLLNNNYGSNKPTGNTFKQKIGVDPMPLPTDEGAEVFKNAKYRCDGVAIGSSVSYSNSNSSVIPPHNYNELGICQNEGCTKKYSAPEQAADGFYELRNAAHIEWLSDYVAAGNLTTNCRMMNDIDFGGVENMHRPIGPNTGQKYNGTFDGQGFRIKNMIINRPDEDNQGFFGFLRGNNRDTEVRNLIIDKSCSITGRSNVGGITASAQNSETNIYIENCINEANITATGNDAGSMIGHATGNESKFVIKNCLNTGRIEAGGYAGALSGWIGGNVVSVTNFVNIGEVVNFDGVSNITRIAAEKLHNCFDMYEYEDFDENELQGKGYEWNTENPLASGELCYVLNGDQSEIAWRQALGSEDYPTVFSKEQVYLAGKLRCDGTPLEGGEYSNSASTSEIPPHTYTEGDYHCDVCGSVNPDYCQKVDDFYQLNSVEDVIWFADYVNGGAVKANAKLNCDLDFNGIDFAGIGKRNMGYVGTFDGGYHTVSNMILDRPEEDWVGFINFMNGGAVIKNLRGDETCEIYANGNAGFLGGSTDNVAGVVIEITNVGFEGNVQVAAGGAAGVLGCNTGSKAYIHMTNCYSTGFISGDHECGAISAWLGKEGAVLKNCWTSADVIGIQENKYMARFDKATLTNCYTIYGAQAGATTLNDEEEIENGGLCFKLNAGLDEPAWFQNIDNGKEQDLMPTFMPGHAVVYAVADILCDGSYDPYDVTYSNSETTDIPPHTFENGFCSVCNTEDPEYPFIKIFPNADHEKASGYMNVQSNDGSKLAINNSVAEHWNQSYFDSYQTLEGLQPGTYKLRVQGYSRVAAWEHENAYESGELNDEYVQLYHNSQYYVEVNGKKIGHNFMDITECAQEESLGDGQPESYSDYTGKYVPNSLAAANKYFHKGLYWNEPIYFVVEKEDDLVRVGVRNQLYLYGNWTVWDTWRLEAVEGEEAADLIRAQQIKNIQELDELEAQVALVDAYDKAKDDIVSASSREEVKAVADVLSRNPEKIRQSHVAYKDYNKAMEDMAELVKSRKDFSGETTDILKDYLTANHEGDENLSNGTWEYIMETRQLSNAQLTEEITFIKDLYAKAELESLKEGSYLTTIIKNADFTEDSNAIRWKVDITKRGESGSNFSTNTGYTDIYPVAASWNTAFTMQQELEIELPDGIYELEAAAALRNGVSNAGYIEELSNAELFINDFYTPVMNVWQGEIAFEDAINGVNCRYDASGDENAPHNGQDTSSEDIETETGYIPGDGRQGWSFAFAGGRYINHAYAIVKGGKLNIGLRNTGEPWYDRQMTLWGKMNLRYWAQSETAMDNMVENFENHLTALIYAVDNQDYYMYRGHIETIESLIGNAKKGSNRMEKLSAVNDAFNATYESHALYGKLITLGDYCIEQADKLEDEEASNVLYKIYDEINNIVAECELTDEEVQAKLDEFKYEADVATALRRIVAKPSYVQNSIYTLSGARVQKAQKGLYIINGKKVLVK